MTQTIPTPDQLSENIYNSVSKSIVNSMQIAQSQAYASQSVEISCDDEAVKYVNDQVIECINQLNNLGKDKDIIKKICKPFIECNATNISIKSSLNITDIIKQTAVIQSTIKNTTTNNVTQDMNALLTNLFLFSESEKQKVSSITDIVSENTQSITQEVYNTFTQQQGLTLTNYQANNITISSVSDIINNSLQNIKGLSSIVTELSNDIVQKMSAKTDTLSTWVASIMFVFLAIFVILFLILFILKRNDTRDFIQMIIPYALFLIGVFIIVGVHMIVKPSYIMVNNGTKYNNINYVLLGSWCTVFAIVLGFIEIIYYKFIKN
jgi:hypothetical protein